MEQAEDTSEKSEEKAGISTKSNDNLMRTMYEIPQEYEIDTKCDKTVIVNSKISRTIPTVVSAYKPSLEESAYHSNNNTEIKENVINNEIQKQCVTDKIIELRSDISSNSSDKSEKSVDSVSANGACDEKTENDDKYKILCDILDSNPEVLQRWIAEKASKDDLNKIGLGGERSKPLSLTPNTATVATDLFQPWRASSPVKVRNNNFNINTLKNI